MPFPVEYTFRRDSKYAPRISIQTPSMLNFSDEGSKKEESYVKKEEMSEIKQKETLKEKLSSGSNGSSNGDLMKSGRFRRKESVKAKTSNESRKSQDGIGDFKQNEKPSVESNGLKEDKVEEKEKLKGKLSNEKNKPELDAMGKKETERVREDSQAAVSKSYFSLIKKNFLTVESNNRPQRLLKSLRIKRSYTPPPVAEKSEEGVDSDGEVDNTPVLYNGERRQAICRKLSSDARYHLETYVIISRLDEFY